MKNRSYIAIDLKSFYASVECVERGLDPLGTNLVVADISRTEKTICLAVSPALKAYGIPGRIRLFEVIERVKEINAVRKRKIKGDFCGESYIKHELEEKAELALSYIAATPRMSLYINYSTRIYGVYLKYIAPEDIHVYSIDEVFMDVTDYLRTYKLSPRQLAMKMIKEVLATTGITATAGIGTNLYLSKVAMDIVAKHASPDKDGVRIAELDEMGYRKILWQHRPLTDFWRIGRGYAARLESAGIYTMGDIARCSLGSPEAFYNEELLYKMFGINAELLIDHAWGWENCGIKDIKNYRPRIKSLSSGQVLQSPYNYAGAKLIVREMTDLLVLDLTDKNMKTDQMVLSVGYDISNLKDKSIRGRYKGEVDTDWYGRKKPRSAHGSINLNGYTSSSSKITDAVMKMYEDIVDPELFVRRICIAANHLTETTLLKKNAYEQLELFTDYTQKRESEKKELKDEKIQRAVADIRKRYGNNAMLRGMNLEEGAMTIKRNNQIGGHRA